MESTHAKAHGGPSSSDKIYLVVFGALAVLTVVTVGVYHLHLPKTQAIMVAVAIAMIKASLVGAFFMHLRHEGRLILTLLVLAGIGLAILILAIAPDFLHMPLVAPGA